MAGHTVRDRQRTEGPRAFRPQIQPSAPTPEQFRAGAPGPTEISPREQAEQFAGLAPGLTGLIDPGAVEDIIGAVGRAQLGLLEPTVQEFRRLGPQFEALQAEQLATQFRAAGGVRQEAFRREQEFLPRELELFGGLQQSLAGLRRGIFGQIAPQIAGTFRDIEREAFPQFEALRGGLLQRGQEQLALGTAFSPFQQRQALQATLQAQGTLPRGFAGAFGQAVEQGLLGERLQQQRTAQALGIAQAFRPSPAIAGIAAGFTPQAGLPFLGRAAPQAPGLPLGFAQVAGQAAPFRAQDIQAQLGGLQAGAGIFGQQLGGLFGLQEAQIRAQAQIEAAKAGQRGGGLAGFFGSIAGPALGLAGLGAFGAIPGVGGLISAGAGIFREE